MAKVTIEDISQETGLSRGTVSRAINNRPDISEATRARVLEACRKLNYRPSHAARSLATGRSYTVTFLYHQMDAFSAQALRGVLAAAAEARYFVHLVSLDQQPAERIAALPSERLDGFIASCPLSREAVSQLAEVHPLRTVVSTTVEGPAGVDVFRPDLREAGRLQARYALSKGRRSGTALWRGAWGRQIAEGVCDSSDFAGTSVEAPVGGAEAIRAAIESGAVLVSDDALGLDVMLEAGRMGRTPGADFALVACGAEPIAAETHPQLTTISLNGEEIGRRLFDTLISRASGDRQDAPRVTDVAPTLIARQT